MNKPNSFEAYLDTLDFTPAQSPVPNEETLAGCLRRLHLREQHTQRRPKRKTIRRVLRRGLAAAACLVLCGSTVSAGLRLGLGDKMQVMLHGSDAWDNIERISNPDCITITENTFTELAITPLGVANDDYNYLVMFEITRKDGGIFSDKYNFKHDIQKETGVSSGGWSSYCEVNPDDPTKLSLWYQGFTDSRRGVCGKQGQYTFYDMMQVKYTPWELKKMFADMTEQEEIAWRAQHTAELAQEQPVICPGSVAFTVDFPDTGDGETLTRISLKNPFMLYDKVYIGTLGIYFENAENNTKSIAAAPVPEAGDTVQIVFKNGETLEVKVEDGSHGTDCNYDSDGVLTGYDLHNTATIRFDEPIHVDNVSYIYIPVHDEKIIV